MQTQAHIRHRADQDVLADWLASARETGVEDHYLGKRSYPRVTWCEPITVEALDGREATDSFFAYANDISAGGMGIRCRERVEVFSHIRVTLDETRESLCGQVRHCTPTPTGFLIGIEFELGADEPAAMRKSA
jgi:hypothetical protein